MVQKLSVLAMLGICSYEDMKSRQIQVKWIMVFSAAGILGTVFIWDRDMKDVLAAIAPGILFHILSYATHGEIGKGDGMVLAAAGLFLSFTWILMVLMCAVIVSSGYALYLYLIRKKGGKYEIPFVPFLLFGFVVNLL